MTMARKLVATVSLLVALTAAVAVAHGGTLRAQRAATRATAPAPGARRPVAMVPGLQYDPGTMIPRGVSGADPDSSET